MDSALMEVPIGTRLSKHLSRRHPVAGLRFIEVHSRPKTKWEAVSRHAAQNAQKEIEHLTQAGYPLWAAREIAQKTYIIGDAEIDEEEWHE